jgi:hypothetical protein
MILSDIGRRVSPQLHQCRGIFFFSKRKNSRQICLPLRFTGFGSLADFGLGKILSFFFSLIDFTVFRVFFLDRKGFIFIFFFFSHHTVYFDHAITYLFFLTYVFLGFQWSKNVLKYCWKNLLQCRSCIILMEPQRSVCQIPVFRYGLLMRNRGYIEFETLEKQCWSYLRIIKTALNYFLQAFRT